MLDQNANVSLFLVSPVYYQVEIVHISYLMETGFEV